MIKYAMVFAAGLGTRMRPLTNTTPKPLITIGAQAMIDYSLNHLTEFGIEHVVVNTHYLPEQVTDHLAKLIQPKMIISHEETLLETGGGIQKALPHFYHQPFFSINGDVVWFDKKTPALQQLNNHFDPDKMDALLLLIPKEHATGYTGEGDFSLNEDGQLMRGANRPYVFSGIQIVMPHLFERDEEIFSTSRIYKEAEDDNKCLRRMYGIVYDGDWLHVGDAEGLELAREYVANKRS